VARRPLALALVGGHLVAGRGVRELVVARGRLGLDAHAWVVLLVGEHVVAPPRWIAWQQASPGGQRGAAGQAQDRAWGGVRWGLGDVDIGAWGPLRPRTCLDLPGVAFLDVLCSLFGCVINAVVPCTFVTSY
jgi:hypothetical protein